MKLRIQEWRQERAKLIKQARDLNDQVLEEKRDFSAEEQAQWDRHMDEAEKLKTKIERGERLLDQEAALGAGLGTGTSGPEGRGNGTRPDPNGQPGDDGAGDGQDDAEARMAQRMAAFRRYLPAWITRDYRGMRGEEIRALQADLDTAGGYLRPPEQFVNELIQEIDDQTYIRQWANTFTVANAESLGVPTLESDPSDADWTTELATGNEDTAMSFGKRALHPHPLAKRIKISRKLIRAVPNSEALVRSRLAYKFGITFEKACLTGTGAGQPLGIFVASTDGISTSRDASTGNTTTAVTFDGLIEAKYTLKAAYWPMARWLGHRDFFKMVAKLKDGDGQYLWRESVRVGEPDRLLGLPAFMSEYAPNTFTSSQYVATLGDFRNYWIADALTMEFQMLQELYAETNQVGLIGRLESDGMPVLEEAFVRVQLAS